MTRREAYFEEAKSLKARGVSHQDIARRLGVERKTVRRWLQRGHAPTWTQAPRPSTIDCFGAYLHKRMAEGCRNVSQLWRELVNQGFKGKRSVVYQWFDRLHAPVRVHSDACKAAVPLGRTLARLLLTWAASQSLEEHRFIDKPVDAEPTLAAAAHWVKSMDLLLQRKTKANIDSLLDLGERTPLAKFAASLRRDINAIKNAIATPWTTSPVEGQISKLKMIKRTMYGRAGFQLLRARILQAQ